MANGIVVPEITTLKNDHRAYFKTAVAESLAPLVSVTVNSTVYAPSTRKTWDTVGVLTVAVIPSPKSQA